MSASPALLSRPLDWKYAPSNLLCWADGFDGYRYRIAAEGDSMDGIVHATFLKMGIPDEEGETVEDAMTNRYPNADAAMVEAQRHQDQRLLAWLNPEVQAQLLIVPAVEAPASETADSKGVKRRSADRTWSVPDMVDRLHRALVQVIETGDTLVPCLCGPAIGSPGRAEHDQAVTAYIAQFGKREFSHERAEALADYLSRLTPPAPDAEYTGSSAYREFWEAEYRMHRDIYMGQRDMLRETLRLGDDAPEVLCMVPPQADVAASTCFNDRVILGHDSEGYRVGLLPVEPHGTVVWTTPMVDRPTATEAAWQLHRDGLEIAIAMEDAMTMNAYTSGGPRP